MTLQEDENTLETITEELEELRSYMEEMIEDGRVSVKEAIYPGVTIYRGPKVFFDKEDGERRKPYEVRDEFKSVTIIVQEFKKLEFKPYEPIEFEDKASRRRLSRWQ